MSWRPGHDPTVDLRDEAALDRAVAARADERLLRQVSAETATMVGTMRDLAERRAGVTLGLTGDRDLQGTVLAVAADHVVVATSARRRAHVRTSTVQLVRPDPRARVPVAQGRRRPRTTRTLAQTLTRWEPERPDLAVVVTGRSEPLRGRLEAVGDDVVSLDDGSGRPVYVAIGALEVVMVDHR